MRLTTLLANGLWTASNLPAYRRFVRALPEPQFTQRRLLRDLLRQNVHTLFGKAHGFERISSYEEFTRRVPLSDYTAFEPWIARIRQGEQNVLTWEPVTHLVPTSGSTSGRKLVPFTPGLQRQFNSGLAAWLNDLTRQSPGLLGGRAYWSISPALQGEFSEESVVPIGFEEPPARAWLKPLWPSRLA